MPDDEKPPTTPESFVARRPGLTAGALVASLAAAIGLGAYNVLEPQMGPDAPTGIFGSVANWVTGGGIMGILGLLVYYLLGSRKVGVEETSERNKDRADIRDHYAAEVSAMRAALEKQAADHSKALAETAAAHVLAMTEIESRYKKLLRETEEHYRKAVVAAEERHDACVKDRDKLGDEVNALKDEVAGLRRQIGMHSVDRVTELRSAGGVSDDVAEASDRVRTILESVPRRDKRKRT